MSKTTMPIGKKQPPVAVQSKTTPKMMADELRIATMLEIEMLSRLYASDPGYIASFVTNRALLAAEIQGCKNDINAARAALFRGFQ